MLRQEERTERPLTQVEDQRSLAEALKDRSPEAWTYVYDRHHDQIYRYALLRTSDPTIAKDLAATTFLEALKSAHTYSYRGRPILAWLYRIARNVVAGHHRASRRARGGPQETQARVLWFFLRSRRRAPSSSGEPALPAEISEDTDPATGVERLDVQAAIRRLPTDQREVIALRYYVGVPLNEVARVMGEPERKIYSLQAKAIETLRRDLEARP